MRECRTYGSVRGVRREAHPYRNRPGATPTGNLNRTAVALGQASPSYGNAQRQGGKPRDPQTAA